MTNPKVIDFKTSDCPEKHLRLADLPDRVVEGDPNHTVRTMFESADGALTVGTWTSTPGKWHAFTDRDEFCYIVSGHVRLIDEDGSANTFRTGDAFLIPNGFRGWWEVVETTTKHFTVRKYDES